MTKFHQRKIGFESAILTLTWEKVHLYQFDVIIAIILFCLKQPWS